MEHLRLSLFSILLFIVFSLQAKTIYYVKTDGAGDGSSWSSAANNIQTMIDKAVSGDEVWVAKGTYYPTTETIARDARSRTFSVKNGVNLYGGFAGSESLASQRLLADLNIDGKVDSCELANTTILSGDIDGVADVWTKTINTDGTWQWTVTGNSGNCYHVVTTNSKIDGFSVIGGNANVVNYNYEAGGIYSSSSVTNCTVSNCSAIGSGGGIYASSVTNCIVSNCSANYGGGIYASSSVTNCTVSDCSANYGGGIYTSSSIINCIVSNCSASINGGGIYASSSVTNCTVSNCSVGASVYSDSKGGGIYASNSVTNCTASNCSASAGAGRYSLGGGIYASSSVTNCIVSNCSANYGGGIYASSSVTNCTVSNCSASGNGGGILSPNSSVANCAVSNCTASGKSGGASFAINCALSNNRTAGVIDSYISQSQGTQCILLNISSAYIQPTSFIGVATNDAEKLELINADWHLKEGSPCINAGTSSNVSTTILTGKDLDNNPRVLHGTIDIGAYEYTVPKIQIPLSENYNNITSWNNSLVFYNSNHINGGQNIMWSLTNQKADFSWQTNLITTYSQPIFTYQIDGTKSSKIYLKYDMYFQAYAGTISPLGTEKLNVEFSTDLVTWSTIATYSNANGTIANQTYKHDISALAAGKTFFIRFNANGANSNRIEKWEIDNVIIDTDVTSAVEVTKADKLLYSINDSKLSIRNIEQGAYVQLFDTNGKLVDSAKANSNTLDFNLPIHGVYILKASSESGVTSRKVVL